MTSITDILPTELITAIVESLASPIREGKTRRGDITYDEALEDLKACSLACRTFVPLCQKYIFNTIEVDTHDTTKGWGRSKTERFSKIVESSPIISGYVEKVTVWLTPDRSRDLEDYYYPKMVASTLRSLTNPKTVIIAVWHEYMMYIKLNWKDLPPSLRSEIYRLFQLPTIAAIEIHNVQNFNIHSIAPCVGLKMLTVENCSFDETPSEALSTAVPVKPVRLIRLNILGSSNERALLPKFISSRLSRGNSIFDFGRLETLLMELIYMDVMHAASNFLQQIKSPFLKTIDFAFPEQISADEIAVLPLYSALKPVQKLDIYFVCHTSGVNDYLLGMCAFLQNLSNDNRVKFLKIGVEYLSSTSDFVQDPNWGVVNNILLTPGWSSLTQVDLDFISFANQESLPQARIRAAILRKLPRTHLKGLSSSRSFKFSWSLKSIVQDPRGFQFNADL